MNEEYKKCPYCQEYIKINAQKCKHCGEWLIQRENSVLSQNETLKKIANFQQISNIIWLVIAILQIISIICIIAGIWNLIAVKTRWNQPKRILERDVFLPSEYESITGLIIILVVNLLLGGVLGVVLVGFDFYIRGLVLDNKNLFTE